MTLRSTLVVLVALSLNLLACGAQTKTPDAAIIITGGGGGGGTGGGTGGGSAGGGTGGGTVDAGVDAGVAACSISTTSFGDKGALTGSVTFDDNMTAADFSDDVVTLQAGLEAAPPADVLSVELYADYGVFKANDGGVIMPGTYAITGDEKNYATCGVCVRILTNATTTAYEDEYMPTGGTVTITAVGNAVGGPFSATVSNLTFRHVNIDGTTFETTPAGDTCASTLANGTYTGVLAAP